MSYYNQIANQAQGFSNFNQEQRQRGQANINDFNIEKSEYTGAEVAHRSGLQALQTGNEMPRLMEEYFGLKPAMKKVVPALLEKSGANAAFKSAIKGTKLEGYLNRAKTATENVKWKRSTNLGAMPPAGSTGVLSKQYYKKTLDAGRGLGNSPASPEAIINIQQICSPGISLFGQAHHQLPS